MLICHKFFKIDKNQKNYHITLKHNKLIIYDLVSYENSIDRFKICYNILVWIFYFCIKPEKRVLYANRILLMIEEEV